MDFAWNQRLEPHWHVHALVPGGGPGLSGDHRKRAEAPPNAANSDGHYLVDMISLRQPFRRHAVAHLTRLRRKGKLKLGGKFEALRDDAAKWSGDGIRGEPTVDESSPRCPHCEATSPRLLQETAKPSCRDVLDHLDLGCPDWYAEVGLADQRR